MNSFLNAVQNKLSLLQGSENPVVQSLAVSLAASIETAGRAHPETPSDPHFKEIAEKISILVETALDKNLSPSAIIDALLEIDTAIMAEESLQKPIASLWSSLTAERALQAAGERQRETVANRLAKSAPIFLVDKRTLCAAPAGPLTEDALSKFQDRVLRRAIQETPKNVLLVTGGLWGSLDPKKHFNLLKEELEALKIELEIRHTTSHE